MPGPLLSIVFTPATPADAERLTRGLQVLLAEDRTLSVRTTETGDVVLGAIGELQLEIVVARLAREFGVTASLGRPRVEPRERISRRAEGEMKLAARKDGRQQYAHVKLRIAPRPAGAGNLIENEILRGSIPDAFLAPIHDGVQRALDGGVLAGYPLIDVKVTLYDGSYHDLDSTEAAFEHAGYLACRAALLSTTPVLVQPVMRLKVDFPEDQKQPVLHTLMGRRLHFHRLTRQDGRMVADGVVAMADLFGLAHELAVCSDGRASYTISLHGYERAQLPRTDESDESGGLGVREPLHPRPTPRAGRVARPLDDL